MAEKKYLTIPEVAKILGISRIAVYKKVRNGQMKAVKIGRNYAVSSELVTGGADKKISGRDIDTTERAVKRTVAEYGEALKLLGRE
ncbi:MAG: hypothetical protein CVU77_06920 [Elusimicrobia bacterium HGW-Elusimicrobia-1]|jgi:excisionase family DNA binding protein|nr:MAG: hypothetical protein CVU77_06920 [Elusimicrobia bacterium HGW-Elusimicrobia-1]